MDVVLELVLVSFVVVVMVMVVGTGVVPVLAVLLLSMAGFKFLSAWKAR